jgi:hypothetical protein
LLLFFVVRKAVFVFRHRITSPEGKTLSLSGSLLRRKAVEGIITSKGGSKIGRSNTISLTILAVATAVREHVQAQFDKEAALLAQVGAAATVDGVKAVVWD